MKNKDVPIILVSITSNDYMNKDKKTYTGDMIFNEHRIYVSANTIPEILSKIKKSLDKDFPDNNFYPKLRLIIRNTEEQLIDDLESY